MKKSLIFLSVVVLSLMLTGCLPKGEENKTVDESSRDEMMIESNLSNDNSLQTIEEEAKETELEDFDKELEDLDTEINQL